MKWKIRNTVKPEGPGPNIFSSDNVKIDDDEAILSINESSSEIYLENVKYGKYKFTLEAPIFLPVGVILGIFLYEDDEHEYDIEFGRWNKFFNKNMQFVKQPVSKFPPRRYWNLCNLCKIEIDYQKDYIRFTVNGIIEEFDNNLTKPSLHINLWKYGVRGYASVKIKDFIYE